MNIPTNPITNDTKSQSQGVAELTEVLEKVIQELAIPVPRTISVFFDGTEVYRQQTEDGSVFWWGAEINAASSTVSSISLVPSH